MILRKSILIFVSMLFVFGTARAQDMTHLWSQRFGDEGGQTGYCVAIDKWDNVIVGGIFYGTLDLGGGPLIWAGPSDEYDLFLAKFDSNGNHIWSKRFGDTGWEYAHGIAVDGAGNIIFVGGFTQTLDFGGEVMTSAGNTDIFVAKFDMDGNHIWSRRFGDSHDSQRAEDVALDAAGNLIIIGSYYGSIDFGGGLLTSAGLHDIYLAKFDADCNHVWSKRFGDLNNDHGLSLAVDAGGNIAVTGMFKDDLDFGGGVMTSAGGFDIYLAKFNSSGNHLHSRRFGDPVDQRPADLSTDEIGNCILVGRFHGTIDFGGGTLLNAGEDDIFIAKFKASGGHIWSKRFGDEAKYQHAKSVAVGNDGQIFMCGRLRGIADFGGGPLEGVGEYDDVFIVKFEANGDHLWSRRFGDSSGHSAECIAVGDRGNVAITGRASGSIDFGAGILMPHGSNEFFIAKFGPQNNLLHIMFDIKPGTCPNPLNIKIYEKPAKKENPKKGGVLPVAILGTPNFNVYDINISTLLFENIPPLRYAYEDVSAPVTNREECQCTDDDSDGYMDLTLKFQKSEIIAQLGTDVDSEMLELVIKGQLNNGTPFEGTDCVKIMGTNKLPSRSDKDRVILRGAIPNPFNPVTQITYSLPKNEYVELWIFDVTGKFINELVARQQTAGEYIIEWNAAGMPSGVYFYRLRVGNKTLTKKMILLK